MEELLAALQGVMALIADGTLVRDTKRDREPGWAIRQIPMVMALKAADAAIAKYAPAIAISREVRGA